MLHFVKMNQTKNRRGVWISLMFVLLLSQAVALGSIKRDINNSKIFFAMLALESGSFQLKDTDLSIQTTIFRRD